MTIEQGNKKAHKFTHPRLPKWEAAAKIGYDPKTTFWKDFSIADLRGFAAIVDTFNNAFEEYQDDVEYIAELVLVLNHKGHWYYQVSKQYNNDEKLKKVSCLYFELYNLLHDWARKNFTGNDAKYYFNTTD